MGDPWANEDQSIVQYPSGQSFEDNFCRTTESLKTFEPLPDSSSYLSNLGLLKSLFFIYKYRGFINNQTFLL